MSPLQGFLSSQVRIPPRSEGMRSPGRRKDRREEGGGWGVPTVPPTCLCSPDTLCSQSKRPAPSSGDESGGCFRSTDALRPCAPHRPFSHQRDVYGDRISHFNGYHLEVSCIHDTATPLFPSSSKPCDHPQKKLCAHRAVIPVPRGPRHLLSATSLLSCSGYSG